MIFWRMYQMSGLAFIFIPISILSYVGVPRDKSNQVSGISNFIRNLGGSVGISMLTTFLARQSQVHQTNLVAHATAANPQFNSMVNGTAAKYGASQVPAPCSPCSRLTTRSWDYAAAGGITLLRQCVLGGVGDRRLSGAASLSAQAAEARNCTGDGRPLKFAAPTFFPRPLLHKRVSRV